MALKEDYITVNQQSVHYWHDATRAEQTLLFLHSEIGDAYANWHAVLPELATHFRVIAPDLPGYGKSQPLSRLSYNEMVGWLSGLFDALAIEKAILIGSSFGALAARLFAAHMPQRVRALALVNGGAPLALSPALRLLARIPGLSGALAQIAANGAVSRDTLDRGVFDRTILTDEFLAAARASTNALAAVYRLSATSTIPTALTPSMETLLLWGANDGWLPLAQGRALAAQLPNATFVPLENCGHFPQLEASDAFVFQAQHFVESLDAPQRARMPGAGKLGGR